MNELDEDGGGSQAEIGEPPSDLEPVLDDETQQKFRLNILDELSPLWNELVLPTD